MTRSKRLVLIFIVLSVFITPQVFSQANNSETHIPSEYEEDEFPVWLQDLRRAEIIAVGSFPFTFFLSQLSYGIYRFACHDFTSDYSPVFFMGSGSANPFTNEEKTTIILISLGLSAAMALTDFIIGKLEE